MRKFKIKVARIERTAVRRSAPEVCITFQMERGAISFQVPVRVRVSDYDDTEAVQAARAILHQTFAELAAQSQDWKLSAKDLRQLSRISLRPGKHSSRVK